MHSGHPDRRHDPSYEEEVRFSVITRRIIKWFVTGVMAVVLGAGGVGVLATSAEAAASSSSTAAKAEATAQKRCGSEYTLGYSVVLRDSKKVARGDLNVLYKDDEATGDYRECRVITSRTKGKFKATLKVTRDDGKVLVDRSGTRSTTFTSFGNHRLGYDFREKASVNPEGKKPKGTGTLISYNRLS